MKFKYILIATILVTAIAISFLMLRNDKPSQRLGMPIAEKTNSVAVLPFFNTGNDSGNAYYSDGIAEGILTSLAKVNGLKVAARFSSFQFRDKVDNIKLVAQQLRVQSILQGSFRMSGGKVLVYAQLFNTTCGLTVWSAEYKENIGDIFVIQDRIAKDIITTLQTTPLTLNEHATGKQVAVSKEVYELYAKGRYYWNLRTPGDLKKSIALFNQALAIEPVFAKAWSAIADCYTALGYGSFIAPKDAFPKALEAANKALAIDPLLADPHATLGFYKFYYEWDWAAAEQEFRIAIAQNQNYEIAYDWYGYYLTAMERYSEAEVIFNKAIDLDPLSHSISTDRGFSLYYARQYDNALDQLKLSLTTKPAYGLAHLWRGRVYQERKLFKQATDEYKQTLASVPGWPVALAAIGNLYGIMGETVKATEILDTLFSYSKTKFVTAYGTALVYAGTGDKENAFIWLDKAYHERSNWLVWLKSDPRWDRIRSDKRFAALVHRVGLPD